MPAPTADYDCGAGPSGDTSCSCDSVWNCIQMVRDGACEGNLTCTGSGCTCDF